MIFRGSAAAPRLLALPPEVNDVMSRKLALTPDQLTSSDCDAAVAALDDLLDLERVQVCEVTLALGPEENRRLLQAAFAIDETASRIAGPGTDDEPTLDARSPIAPFVARITSTRPPPLKALVFTSPPPPRRVDAKAPQDPQLLVVAGIWAVALSLMVTLAVIAAA